MTVASDDALYVNGIGNFAMFPGTDGLFSKYNADATQELWSFCDDSGADTSPNYTKPYITTDGGVINYGSLGDATSPPDPVNGGPSAFDLFIRKFDSDGNISWTRQIETTRSDGSDAIVNAGSVAEDSQGIFYITGFTDGELTGSANAGDTDAFVMRLEPDGAVQ